MRGETGCDSLDRILTCPTRPSDANTNTFVTGRLQRISVNEAALMIAGEEWRFTIAACHGESSGDSESASMAARRNGAMDYQVIDNEGEALMRTSSPNSTLPSWAATPPLQRRNCVRVARYRRRRERSLAPSLADGSPVKRDEFAVLLGAPRQKIRLINSHDSVNRGMIDSLDDLTGPSDLDVGDLGFRT
jgi:hypothetical protein